MQDASSRGVLFDPQASLARLLLGRARRGRLTLRLGAPDQQRAVVVEGDEPGPQAVVAARNLLFLLPVLRSGDIGLAEAYVDGAWTTPDLCAVLRWGLANHEAVERMVDGGALSRAANRLRHALRRNTRSGSRRNISAHYDLGNEFFSRWLDPSMTYSAARFSEADSSLEQAQRAKYRSICERLALRPDSRVLEIGCGWGGFAEYVVREHGCHLTCLTISEKQRDYAAGRMRALGASGRVSVLLEDYRDHRGRYHAVASIEMLEAVGEAYWPAYFRTIADNLEPGGRAAVQVISIEDELFSRYREQSDFIKRYIFPGGMLVSVARMKEAIAGAGLGMIAEERFGHDYARTLEAWRDRFVAASAELEGLGYDERFQRLWRFYFDYCRAGFLSGRIDVGQYWIARS